MHDKARIAGFSGAFFGVFYHFAANAFALITAVDSNLHHADFLVVDRRQNQSADQRVVQAFDAADVKIAGFLVAVHVQKFETQRFEKDFVAEFDQVVIAGRSERNVNHFFHGALLSWFLPIISTN